MRIASLLLTALLAGTVFAADPIAVEGVWARATPPGARTGAVYLTLDNTGPADRLTGAIAGVADEVQIHAHVHEDGMMKMEQQNSLPVHTGNTVFEPGGLHLMLIGLSRPLAAGESFELTLQLEKAGELRVEVPVRDGRP